MENEHFSFRWGIPWLDAGFVQVPDFFFDTYVEMGVTGREFLFILHLARYKYESVRGQSRPSLLTIAGQMGVSKRHLRRLRSSLEDKGLLIVTEMPGRPSVYDFQNFALVAMRKAATTDTQVPPDIDVLPTPDMQVLPPRTPRSSKEHETSIRKQQHERVAVSAPAAVEEGKEALQAIGIEGLKASGLLERYGTERVVATCKAVQGKAPEIRNPAGWVLTALEKGYEVSSQGDGSPGKPNRRLDVSRCAYVRSPAMGKCPTEEKAAYLAPWCKACDRASAVKMG